MNIYQINKDLEEIEQQLEEYAFENDGELSDELLEKERNIFDALENKHEAYAIVIKNKLALDTALKAEKKAIDVRIKSNDNIVERMKSVLSESLGGEKYESGKCKISFRASKTLNVLDEDAITVDYLKTKTTVTIDKAKAKKDIANGIEVAGCEVVENSNIQIK